MCGKCRMDRVHAVCFKCRYSVKRWTWMLGRCPKCRTELRNAGVAFATPQRNDTRGWVESERYVRHLERLRHQARERYKF